MNSIVLVIVCIIIATILLVILRTRCDECGKVLSVKKRETWEVGRESISVRVETKQKDVNGNVTGTSEQYVPGERITYKTEYVCRNCGQKYYKTHTKDKAKV